MRPSTLLVFAMSALAIVAAPTLAPRKEIEGSTDNSETQDGSDLQKECDDWYDNCVLSHVRTSACPRQPDTSLSVFF